MAVADLALMPREIVPVDYSERDCEVMEALLREHGQPMPVLVQASSGRVFWGGDIVIAAKRAGLAQLQVLRHDVGDREASRISIRMRRAVELQRWHDIDLARLMSEMEDPEALGFDDKEFERLLADVDAGVDKPVAPEPEPRPDAELEQLRATWKTEPGQVWVIASASMPGRSHRLAIGSSADAEVVKRVMAGERATVFATDPPYCVDYTGDDRPKIKRASGSSTSGKDWSAVFKEAELTPEQCDSLYRGFMRAAIDHAITDDAAWYCWHADKRRSWLEGFWREFGVLMHQTLIWSKTKPVITHSMYLWQHEPCVFGWVEGHKPKLVQGMMGKESTIWVIENPVGGGGEITWHPTPKPVQVWEVPMQMHTVAGDLCYEPFAGSGSQFAAGERMRRRVYGVELSPFFAAGILQRLRDMGCEPVLEEGSGQ